MYSAKKLKQALAGLALLSFTHAASAEVVVVVSAKNPTSSLTAEQASDLFLGEVATFPSGGQAVPVDQADGAHARDEFYTKAAGKTSAQLKAYWAKVIFTGRGKPPKAAADSATVKQLVADNPNMIGYMDRSAVDASVKVVLTLR
ncbi:phosphate ABC transporter substrate-binding protein [Massilia phosphatilytica]|jgi:ABC-type phosphate transport system substrate-binding protein|nr:phosphate ABC transporter substrate-binding protein [Massilia phosphatilytica]